MLPIVILPLSFREKKVECLIRLLRRENRTLLRVTVMDGDLEKILTSANTFEVHNGFVVAELSAEPGIQRDLQIAIMRTLDDHFAATSLRETLAATEA